MTLTGFLLLVVHIAFLTFYDYDFYASSSLHPDYPPVPGWVWIFSFFCLFVGELPLGATHTSLTFHCFEFGWQTLNVLDLSLFFHALLSSFTFALLVDLIACTPTPSNLEKVDPLHLT